MAKKQNTPARYALRNRNVPLPVLELPRRTRLIVKNNPPATEPMKKTKTPRAQKRLIQEEILEIARKNAVINLESEDTAEQLHKKTAESPVLLSVIVDRECESTEEESSYQIEGLVDVEAEWKHSQNLGLKSLTLQEIGEENSSSRAELLAALAEENRYSWL